VSVRVGINGFGRIGRNFWRAVHAAGSGDIDIVAANDLGDLATFAHLLKYDTLLGTLADEVTTDGDVIRVGRHSIRMLAERDPAQLPWGELGVDVVIESTGRFTSAQDARKHLDGGARKVIISAPAKGEDITIVMGVNDDKYDPARHSIISNASCTTNCVAPMAKVLNDSFGIRRGLRRRSTPTPMTRSSWTSRTPTCGGPGRQRRTSSRPRRARPRRPRSCCRS
jgi:glyceraldehyde 3-phosphate dehydrogenase